jgi:peptidoglycan-N-acetylglucosamine deacetylase
MSLMTDTSSDHDVQQVMLTFDDGPHPECTPALLDVLAAESIRATFFVCGKHVAQSFGRRLAERVVSEGHQLGNHAYSHERLTKLAPDQVHAEIVRTHNLIADLEPTQKLFRPPYGSYHDRVRDVLDALNYQLVLWDVDSQDWRPERQPDEWIAATTAQIRDRRHSILLFHDKIAATVQHFGRFVRHLRSCHRVAFVTSLHSAGTCDEQGRSG